MPGAWTLHTGTTMPVVADTVVEIEGADGSRHIGPADELVWRALPADEGLIVRYRVLSPASSSTSTTGSTGGVATDRPCRSSPRGRRVPAGRAATPRRTVMPMTACFALAH